MSMRSRFATLTWACLLSTLPLTSNATTEVRGVKFDDTVELAQQQLQLNGAGVRVKLIVDIYAASLYLPHKSATAEDVLAQPGPKSVHAVLLRDVTAKDFVGALIKGFKANNSAEQYQRYLPRLEELSRLMEQVGSAHKGTLVRLDYVPQVGTRIYMDGKRQGTDLPGEDFYQGLLRIWLGPKPVDGSLKAALLGSTGEARQ